MDKKINNLLNSIDDICIEIDNAEYSQSSLSILLKDLLYLSGYGTISKDGINNLLFNTTDTNEKAEIILSFLSKATTHNLNATLYQKLNNHEISNFTFDFIVESSPFRKITVNDEELYIYNFKTIEEKAKSQGLLLEAL